MSLKEGEQRAAILKEVWLESQLAEDLSRYDHIKMVTLMPEQRFSRSDAPWSTSFYDCCKEVSHATKQVPEFH